jgi:hypothetical protein
MKYIFTTEQRASGGKIRAQALQEKAAIEIENGTWKPTHDSLKTIKNYLLNKRGHKCESCFNELWLDKPIPLETHHINGDAKNNLVNNLQLLCPNCHALTDSYKGKNRGNGKRKR